VAAMRPSVTAILAVSLGGAFAAAVVSILVAAKRQKAATDKDLDQHSDGKPDASPSDSDSSAAAAGSDGGVGGSE
jgi:hypothetical protein